MTELRSHGGEPEKVPKEDDIESSSLPPFAHGRYDISFPAHTAGLLGPEGPEFPGPLQDMGDKLKSGEIFEGGDDDSKQQ